MRAPPESFSPSTGAPTFMAMSMTLQILAEDVDQPAVDRAVARHHAVARDLLGLHAEIDRAMLDEHVVFLERSGIEQRVDALAGRQLALGVLRLDAALPASQA